MGQIFFTKSKKKLDSIFKVCHNRRMGHIRPTIDEGHIEQIKGMIRSNPGWNRTKLSRELCKLWGWQSAGGQIKDISCRDMLRDLDRAGAIRLPPALWTPRKPGKGAEKVKHLAHKTEPIEADLHELMPLRLDMAASKPETEEFKSYIDQYHYLGYDRSVGENIKYIVKSNGGAPIACLMFSSSAWKCQARDEYIRWDANQRKQGLHLVTNNSRFLIFPWVRVFDLASHVLSLAARRVSADWEAKYGHHIILLETFVECGRFRGSCYKAANWVCVGRTTGRGRDDREHRRALPEKDVYLLPLTRKWREKLLAE
jgi:hypothetical protein